MIYWTAQHYLGLFLTYHMTQVLPDLLECSLSEHTAAAPKEHKSELSRHLNPTDGADVGGIALTHSTICVVCRYICWILDEVQVFDILKKKEWILKINWLKQYLWFCTRYQPKLSSK